MMTKSISNLTAEEKDKAYQEYQLIEPYLNSSCSLKSISKKQYTIKDSKLMDGKT